MPERFREIEKGVIAQGNESKSSREEIQSCDRELLRRLGEYPELKAKIENLLGIIENAGGDVEKANAAEQQIIEELRQMGHEVLQGWGRRQQQKKEEPYQHQPGVNRKEKKHSTGTRD
jgi:chromosome segregation ATPase